MDNNAKRRIMMKLKHPNPLFEKWLIEWRDKAKQNESKMQHCFTKALQSLRKYPLPLETGKDCKILQGFGNRLCQMLDEKLRDSKNTNVDVDCTLPYQPDISKIVAPKTKKPKRTSSKVNSEPLEDSGTLLSKKKRRTSSPKASGLTKQYCPAYRSGGYAILVALYKKSLEPSYKGFLTKNEIVKQGQCLCEKSFTKPEPGTFYTSWSSMKTLIEKKLVLKQGNPSKFSLSDEGLVLAHKLYRVNLEDKQEGEELEHISTSLKNYKSNEVELIELDKPTEDKSKSINEEAYTKSIHDVGIIDVDVCNEFEDKTHTQLSNTETNAETLIFTSYSFDIFLVVDVQETSGTNAQTYDDPLLSELLHLNVQHEVKHLTVGDYVWICRDRETKCELVLPYVVERKRMDDFGSSIKDGRYHEQKFRLKQCGMQNVIYLVESYGDNKHTGLPLSTLYQAAVNTMLHDGFQVKLTDGIRGTAHYLRCMTKMLQNKYKSKTLMSCPKKNLENSIDDDLIPLLTFKEFNQSGSIYRKFTARQLFIRQLLQLKGLSVDKALAIVEIYPTPRLLKSAYTKAGEAQAEKLLMNIQFGKNNKRIGPVISKTIYLLYK